PNVTRTLDSVMPLVRDGQGEIVVLDSGSTDGTLEIARAHGAKVFVEPWKGFAAQKNSAMDKASGDWVLQLDADEAPEPELTEEIAATLRGQPALSGYRIPRKNFFLVRWIMHVVFYLYLICRVVRR